MSVHRKFDLVENCIGAICPLGLVWDCAGTEHHITSITPHQRMEILILPCLHLLNWEIKILNVN